ncbi:Uu.00g060760.m01.CDS01 [Anthostomella pinea]|uniref:Uu.00g060760.m01.CDS01 n=1 Tax=Anthostomella pinea TaxID=933095 RepID=A0AAI8VSD1_9PEZI|nr:Uu.00g060760.m01.CDS01 [Anthostomella pinea]
MRRPNSRVPNTPNPPPSTRTTTTHNDYAQRIPLFEALGSGCISVEADVHLRDADLLDGHFSTSLSPDNLNNAHNHTAGGGGADAWRGIFDRAPQQTVLLLIDHKTSGARARRPGLTIVASGNAPFDSVTALNATHRDIFRDAEIEALASVHDDFPGHEAPTYAYNVSNSYFASTQFALAQLWTNATAAAATSPSSTPRRNVEAALPQIEQAPVRGLVARYWDTPASPPNLKEVVWRVLVERGVGVLNLDDMGGGEGSARVVGEDREVRSAAGRK